MFCFKPNENTRRPLLTPASPGPSYCCCSQAVDMLIDVLSDRGFSVAHSGEERVVPERVDLKTGEVESRVELVHKFR